MIHPALAKDRHAPELYPMKSALYRLALVAAFAAAGCSDSGSGNSKDGSSGGAHSTPASGGGGTTGAGGNATGGTSTILGATPPMGWSSRNQFGCDGLNEAVIKEMADAFETSGMKAVGYQYVNLDDCWMDGRDNSGKLNWNASKFPGGIPALAEYIHGKGLKLGIYETPNSNTCANIFSGYPGGVGSLGHETSDAQTFASWGIDFLKYDKCFGDPSGFAVMRDALRATGRPIFYSINPVDAVSSCVPTDCSIDLVQIANMWRIGTDLGADWDSVTRLVDANKEQYVAAGPGHWNDPDMLQVGNGLNDTEGRAHFSLWVIMAAPLIAGNDLRTMTEATKAILTNPEAIAIHQDPLGKQGRVVATPGSDLEVWSKELAGTNARGVALFNRSPGSANMTVTWSDIGLPAGTASVRDIWAAKDVGPAAGSYTASNVPSHGVVLLKIVSGGN